MHTEQDFKQIFRLKNTIQYYAWGSPEYIPELLDIKNPEGKPYAEMWMGGHPKAPSSVLINKENGISLIEMIKKNPEAILGKEVFNQFGAELPFLFKVLAAAKPLSIQAHPSRKQAVSGFTRENKQGISLKARQRNYRDANHKPELIVALTPFQAMRSFRQIPDIIEEFSKFEIDILNTSLKQFRLRPDREGLKNFFYFLMTLGDKQKEEIIYRIIAGIGKKPGLPYKWVLRLQEFFPNDIGVICPLLLNVVSLAPGQAMFLPAGELHSYLKGQGLEIMANSDNVLRGGLTKKHIDVVEMLNTLTFKPEQPEILTPVPLSDYEKKYPAPVNEFCLSIIKLKNNDIYTQKQRKSAEICLVLNGEIQISSTYRKKHKILKKGDSILIPAALPDYFLSGKGELYKAGVGI